MPTALPQPRGLYLLGICVVHFSGGGEAKCSWVRLRLQLLLSAPECYHFPSTTMLVSVRLASDYWQCDQSFIAFWKDKSTKT